jgi:hypothetical protein
MYEMYRLRGPVKYTYKAAVGTTTNGEFLMGVDYDARDVILSYSGTAALSPKSMGPVWRDHTLVVPTARAMKQKWLTTSNLQDDHWANPAFGVNMTGTAVSATGSIWVEYHIEFCSPRAPTSPAVIGGLVVPSSSAGVEIERIVGANPIIAPIPFDEIGSFVATLTGVPPGKILPVVKGYTVKFLERLNGVTDLGDTPWDKELAFQVNKEDPNAELSWLDLKLLHTVVPTSPTIARLLGVATNINVLRKLASYGGYNTNY